jgi:hypothetical protein
VVADHTAFGRFAKESIAMKNICPKFRANNAIGRPAAHHNHRTELGFRTNTTMGCCFSCESTPDVPENIIPDPVVRFPADPIRRHASPK